MWTEVGEEGRALDLEVGADGRVVIVGWVEGLSNDSAAFIRGYEPDGDPVFGNIFYGESSFFSGITLGDDGSLTAAGAKFSEASGWDIWVVHLDANGDVQWEDLVGEAGEDQAVGVTAGPTVAGYVMNDDGTTDAWVRRYEADGQPRWTHTHDGAAASFDVATEVSADGDGVLVVGYETNANDDTDLWLRSLDADGQARWTSYFAGAAGGGDRGQAVAIDERGPIAVGSSTVAGRTIDAWIGRFDAGGTLTWFDEHDGPASLGDAATDVAIGPGGSVAIAGYEFFDAEKWDGCVRLLSAGGDTRWTHRFRGELGEDDVASSIAFGPEGDVYVAGSTSVGPQTPAIWLRRIAEGTASP